MDCIVCCEQVDKNITCYCDVICCMDCLEKWILSNPSHEPNCVQCKKILTQDTIYSNLSTNFLKNEYTDWRSSFLFEKESVYFATDMEDVSIELDRRAKMLQIKTLRKQKKRLRKNESPNDINQQIKSIQSQLSRPLFPLKHYDRPIHKASSLLLPCPKNCRGYILEKTYSCALCKTELCRKCLQITDNCHTCLDQDVSSALKILEETRPCPRCAIRIYKISGCDQMWCVQCHSSFSWQTGQIIVNGAIHNPHYYDWLYSNRQENVEGEDCQRFEHVVMHHLRKKKCKCTYQPTCKHKDMFKYILHVIRNLLHIENVILIRYNIDHISSNRDLRLKYLLKELDRDDVERILLKREKRNLKKGALYSTIATFVETEKDILYRFVSTESWDNLEIFNQEINEIIKLTQNNIEHIISMYGGRFLEISFFK